MGHDEFVTRPRREASMDERGDMVRGPRKTSTSASRRSWRDNLGKQRDVFVALFSTGYERGSWWF